VLSPALLVSSFGSAVGNEDVLSAGWQVGEGHRKKKPLDIVEIAAILSWSFRDRSPIGPGLFPSALVLLGVYVVEN
jgi:hypothetical protein